MGGANEIARMAPPLSPLRTSKGAPLLGAPEAPPSASIDALRPAQEPQTLIVTIAGRIDRADAARFGEEVADRLYGRHTSLVVCDVGGLIEPDGAAVDAVCRIRLAARHAGSGLLLGNASPEILDLLDLLGLCGVLRAAPRSELEAKRQPEEREHPRGVEEEGDPADPTA